MEDERKLHLLANTPFFFIRLVAQNLSSFKFKDNCPRFASKFTTNFLFNQSLPFLRTTEFNCSNGGPDGSRFHCGDDYSERPGFNDIECHCGVCDTDKCCIRS